MLPEQATLAGVMGNVAGAMREVNSQVNSEDMAKVMQQFAVENERMGMTEEMMDDALIDAVSTAFLQQTPRPPPCLFMGFVGPRRNLLRVPVACGATRGRQVVGPVPGLDGRPYGGSSSCSCLIWSRAFVLSASSDALIFGFGSVRGIL